MDNHVVSKQTLKRLPLYLNYLKALPENSSKNISATTISQELGLNHVQVRKDLAQVSSGGRPKIGYVTKELIIDIEKFLGYDDSNDAILVGAGKLGSALLSFDGFKDYGLNIVSAFDSCSEIIGKEVSGKIIFPIDKIKDLCQRLNVKIGIITVPDFAAQEVCDLLVDCGIQAIWNFAPVHLKVPDGILVQQENMASGLAVLSNHLAKKMHKIV